MSIILSKELVEEIKETLEANMFYSIEEEEFNNDDIIDVLDKLNKEIKLNNNIEFHRISTGGQIDKKENDGCKEKNRT